MDQIEFLFSANLGAAPLPIHACASGGELSRLFFAMKIILAEQNECSCLVFDEIDGNVGGQTASILGEKLKQLSKKNQVICISHFIQVAKHAQAHFRVYKEEKSGCAITMIQELSKTKREDEYTRMVGQLD
jgi:DNA repair protein RecN (Recombination protein N)